MVVPLSVVCRATFLSRRAGRRRRRTAEKMPAVTSDAHVRAPPSLTPTNTTN